MNNNDKEFLVQKIRAQYIEKEYTQLDELKALDKKVKKPALVLAYVLGIVGSLVFGWGMCLAMNVMEPGTYYGIVITENMMLQGVLIGLVGMLMMIVNYPLYKTVLNVRRERYSDEIVRLSDMIMEKNC